MNKNGLNSIVKRETDAFFKNWLRNTDSQHQRCSSKTRHSVTPVKAQDRLDESRLTFATIVFMERKLLGLGTIAFLILCSDRGATNRKLTKQLTNLI